MSREEVQELFGRARDAIQTSQRIAEQLAISEKRAVAGRAPPAFPAGAGGRDRDFRRQPAGRVASAADRERRGGARSG